MIDDVDHPRMKRALRALQTEIAVWLRRRPELTADSVRDLGDLLAAHRRRCRQRMGVDFPVLTAFVFPQLRVIDLVRADLQQDDIEKTLVNFTVKYPGISAPEIAWALMHAFPDYRPRMLQ